MTETKQMQRAAPKTILVTGGSGFVASHVILQLLEAGHHVRTTLRQLAREPEIRNVLRVAAPMDMDQRLKFFAADLEEDQGWKEAVQGCEYVLHVASPFPSASAKTEDELIRPAREGALRILRAARDAGVLRVVMTSSFAAIGYGHEPRTTPFDESTWSHVEGRLPAYHKSKTLAERAAWDFISREGGKLELTVVNPTGIFGPVLSSDFASSIEIVLRMLKGGFPICPQISFGVVDVRDVADLHLRAMTEAAAAGQRFIAVAGDPISIPDIAKLLKAKLGPKASKVSTRVLPTWLLKIFAIFSSQASEILPELQTVRLASADKARRVLNWNPRSREDALLATAESLLRLGLVPGAQAK